MRALLTTIAAAALLSACGETPPKAETSPAAKTAPSSYDITRQYEKFA